MVKTCNLCHGRSYRYDEAKLKRCSGCQKVYYCSTECQKEDWVYHIFNCKPRRPINTADYLALAVFENVLPEHPQTCEDYGFSRALTGEEKSNLLGLYIGLIKVIKIPPKTIHGWRVRGVLVDEIKATFYKIPERNRGGYFPWFLQNEHIIALAGQPPSDDAMHDHFDAMMMRAWRFIGGSEKDSGREIMAAVSRKSVEERDCYQLYSLLLSKWRPHPELELWIDFGFASCRGQDEEWFLCIHYQRLITLCTFEEFCGAYRGRRLLDLFHSKGIKVADHRGHLQDLLHGPADHKKSVWYLKQTIVQEDSTKEESGMVMSVRVDYGFMNCKNDSERRQLKRVYKAFFESPDGDPLALHEAAIKGNLHGYLSTVIKGLKDPKFKRLMKNPYPLPDL